MTANLNLKVVVPGEGPLPCNGVIIGEAPGRTEIEQGRPFCGRSGALLDESLRLSGYRREQFYITNIFKGDVGLGNRNPTTTEIDSHWDYLLDEIGKARPKGLLLLGRVATEAFVTITRGMGACVGERIPSGSYVYFPCWHPAYILRNPSKRMEFDKTISLFATYCYGES